jgi:PKD repeat protein
VTAPNLPSTVSPTATPPSGPAPLSVQFTAGADDVDGDPLTYLWDFGDGATSTQANPSHVYTAVGLYTATVTVRDGINIPVSASVMIDVTTALPDCSIEVEEYKLNRGGDHDVNGKVSLDVNFQCGGIPAADDAIRVVFDGIELANIRFGDFRQKQPGRYEYKEKGLHLDLDFNKSRLKISRHKLRRDGVDDSNGIEVLVAFGAATAVDHIDADKVEHDDGEGRDSDREKKGKSKESSHKKHRERD